jgi:hypothetical protein
MRTSRSHPAGRATSLPISGVESKYETRSAIRPLVNVKQREFDEHLMLAVADPVHVGVKVGH